MKRGLAMFVAILGIGLLVFGGGRALAQESAIPYLGIQVISNPLGALVVFVDPGSPAEAAGVHYLDIITNVNDQKVTATSLNSILRQLSIGDQITLSIKRGETDETLTATLAALPDYLPLNAETISYDGETMQWYISTLTEDEPLYEAGLRAGDYVLNFDGTTYSPQGLVDFLAGKSDTDMVNLAIKRDGADMSVDLPVSALLTMETLAMDFLNVYEFPYHVFFYPEQGVLGVVTRPMNSVIAAEYDVDNREGALVLRVVDGSPAANAGLESKDVITSVNGEAIDAEHTFQDRIGAYEAGDTVDLQVYRGADELQFEATLVPQTLVVGNSYPFPDYYYFGGE